MLKTIESMGEMLQSMVLLLQKSSAPEIATYIVTRPALYLILPISKNGCGVG